MEPRRHARIARVFDLFARHEEQLSKRLLDYLRAVPSVRIIGNLDGARACRAPTISFTVANRPSQEIASALATHKLAVRAGHFYAWRCLEALGIDSGDGVVRASMVHYNTLDDVERLIAGLEAVL